MCDKTNIYIYYLYYKFKLLNEDYIYIYSSIALFINLIRKFAAISFICNFLFIHTHTHIYFFLHLFYNLIIILYVTRDDVEQYLLTILSNKNLYATYHFASRCIFALSCISPRIYIYIYAH